MAVVYGECDLCQRDGWVVADEVDFMGNTLSYRHVDGCVEGEPAEPFDRNEERLGLV